MKKKKPNPYKDDLLTRVEVAFADIRYPGDKNIITHECGECFKLRDAFKRKSPAAAADISENFCGDLPLFSNAARVYFLPAFLEASIEKPKGNVTQYLLMSLGSARGMYPACSKKHADVVLEYLDFIETYDVSEEDLFKARESWKKVL